MALWLHGVRWHRGLGWRFKRQLRSLGQLSFDVFCHWRQHRCRLLGPIDDGLEVLIDGVGNLQGVLSRESIPTGNDVLLPDRDQVIGILLVEARQYIVAGSRNGGRWHVPGRSPGE